MYGCRSLAFGVALCLAVSLTTSKFSRLDSPYPINCDQPRPRICSKDFTPHCLKGVKHAVFGHCEYQDAVCDKGAKYDPTFNCEIY